MTAWSTSLPTEKDYPIQAWIGIGAEELVTVTSDEQLRTYPEYQDIIWSSLPKAPVTAIPTPPPVPDDHVSTKFLVLEKAQAQGPWTAAQWFKAGYDYGRLCKGTLNCDKGQALFRGESTMDDYSVS